MRADLESSSAVPVSSTVMVMMPNDLARVDRCMSFLVILRIDISLWLKILLSPYSRIIPENDFAFLFVKVQDLVLLLITVRVHLLILGGIKSRMITDILS